jgi:catechol 2,3-dioxygenase-like lactoylglutathione lyase family enzyme
MKLTSVAHTGFTVSNLDRSLAFYRDMLGMHVM